MKGRPPLRQIDLLAPEHGIDPVAQADSLRQLEQELERLFGDAVLRVIEVDPTCLGGHVLAALWIICEQCSQMDVTNLGVMRL
jgi:hypothetical protein